MPTTQTLHQTIQGRIPPVDEPSQEGVLAAGRPGSGLECEYAPTMA